MRYFIAGILILCTVSAFCALNMYLEDRWFGEMRSSLEDARRYSCDGMYDAALVCTNAACDIWFRHRDYLSVVLKRDDIDLLDRSLQIAAGMRDPSGLAGAVAETLIALDGILDGERLTVGNIF